MRMDEEAAWRRRMEFKLDRLAYHMTCVLLACSASALPPAPSATPTRAHRPGRWRSMGRRLLADLIRSLGEKLVPYIIPALGTALVLGRHWLAKLWELLCAAF